MQKERMEMEEREKEKERQMQKERMEMEEREKEKERQMQIEREKLKFDTELRMKELEMQNMTVKRQPLDWASLYTFTGNYSILDYFTILFILDLNSEFRNIKLWDQFVCVEVLRPSQPNGVMSSAVSLPNHTFTGQA